MADKPKPDPKEGTAAEPEPKGGQAEAFDERLHPVINENGEVVGQVRGKDLGKLPTWARIASGEEEDTLARQQYLENKYGGVLRGAQAAALGAGEGLTMGLSTAALAQLGGEGVRQEMADLFAAHPGARAFGDVVGGAVGLGKLGRLGRIVGAPTRGAAALGEAGTAFAARRGAGTALSYAAGGAVEGGLQGLGAGIAQASLDNELNGEMLAASTLLGAGAGGVLGGGIGALTAVGRRVGGALAHPGEAANRGVLEAAYPGDVAPGLGSKLNTKMSDFMAMVSDKPKGAVRLFTALDDQGAEAHRLLRTEITDDTMRAQAEGLQALEDSWSPLAAGVRSGGTRRHQALGLVEAPDVANTAQAYRQSLTETRTAILELERDGFSLPGAKDIQAHINAGERRAANAIAKNSPRVSGEMFHTLDTVRGAIGRVKQATPSGGAVSERLERAYNSLNKVLRDESLWGAKAAQAHAKVSGPVHDVLLHEDQYRKALLASAGEDIGDPWARRGVIDGRKLDGVVRAALSPKNDVTLTSMRQTLNARKQAAEAMLKNWNLSTTQRRAARKYIKDHDRVMKDFDKLLEVQQAKNQFKSIQGGLDWEQRRMMLGMLGAAGVASGDPQWGIAGLALSALANPASVARVVGAVHKLTGRARRAVVTEPGKVKATRAIVEPKRSTTRSQFVKAATALANAASLEAQREKLKFVAADMPTTTNTAVETSAKAQEVLQAALPKGPRPTDAEVWAYMQVHRGVTNPMAVVADILGGKPSSISAKAMAEVYPRMLGQLQVSILETIGSAASRGKQLDYQSAVSITMATGIVADPTMDPRLVAMLQAGYAKPEEPAPQPAPSGEAGTKRFAKAYMSGSAQLESGEVR